MMSIRSVALGLTLFAALAGAANAQSVASFPPNWENWPTVKESFVPGRDVVLPPETPIILQDTIRYVNDAFDGQSTRLRILINPEKLQEYAQGGPYSDGSTAIGIFDDTGVVFVTEHLLGQAIYGVFDLNGHDLAGSRPIWDVQHCIQCHDENTDICRNGVCTADIDEAFVQTNN